MLTSGTITVLLVSSLKVFGSAPNITSNLPDILPLLLGFGFLISQGKVLKTCDIGSYHEFVLTHLRIVPWLGLLANIDEFRFGDENLLFCLACRYKLPIDAASHCKAELGYDKPQIHKHRFTLMQTKLRHQNSSLFSFIILYLSFVATSQPGECASKEKQWLSVPVFYATSRQYDKGHAVYSGRRSPEHENHGIEYGIVTTVIPVTSIPASSNNSMPNLSWKSASKKDSKLAPKLDKLSREEFFKRLAESTNSTNFNEACLFVHGYNNTFEGAAQSAARLETALNEPVILFSWPSAAKTKDYTVDECNAEWSVRPFQIFAQGLENKLGPEKLMTVSHSMGNRLINWYLQSRYDKANQEPKHFKEIVLTSPDIDRGTFKNYFYKIANNGDKVRLFISDKDFPLRLSKFIHGSPRTGTGLTKEENKWDMPGNITPTQTVNFTEVDDSSIGHSIQYRLIGSMHRTNTPGDGLRLEQDKDFKGDYVKVRKDSN